jgi:Lrp/AsnC family transcriptional regulator for asnA, asnC and gidA
MNDLDKNIIQILQVDGRTSHADIARQLQISEGTIRRHLAALIENKIIRVAALIDPAQLGYKTSAFIGIQVEPSKVETVADELAALSESEHVVITTGSYDIFMWVNVATSEDLAKFLHTRVGVIKGVRHTETFVNLLAKKRMAGPRIIA